jgi:serine/threonine protein kinase/tetratricopeptide (TPR) repeat protein
MSANPHRDVAIFAEAVNLPAVDRATFLDRACAGDAALRRRVEVLLQAHDAAHRSAEVAPDADATAAGGPPPDRTVDAVARTLRGAPQEAPGQKIGHYKLLQKIGEGGCGVVYMAEQEEPVRRRVALKVVKLGMDTREVIARFEAERQALAMMDHPNIAKVFDAGATATGRPFFVMELVRGVPITDYCDQNSLPTADRLQLFTAVCHAIQHAHQKGIIHRDLKPTNILVTLHDGTPVPKVIDFGIAKATSGRLTDETVFTAFEQFVGTPAYMSPEQAEMSALDVDTRTDIYSLGVLLYELLTGRTPFDAKTLLQAGLGEMRRHIREVEPPRPSTRLSTLQGDALDTAARQRQLAAPKLVSLIRGDLDWIVMRCLEKDRARRYETADSLAHDLQRYLQHEPVTACPPSAAYRLRKFVRRNRLAVGAAATVVAALFFGLGFSIWAYFQEKAARREAQLQATKSDQITSFLQTMLGGARPSVALGRDNTLLRDMMDKTAARLGHDLAGQPEVEARLRSTLGTAYLGLNETAKAEAMHRDALALRRRLHGDVHLDVAATLNDLALVLNARGDLVSAEAALREALASRRQLLRAPKNELVAKTLNDLACTLRARGDLAAADTLLREALALERQADGRTAATLVTMLGNLSAVAAERGDDAGAEAFQRDALLELRRWFSDSLWTPAGRKRADADNPDRLAEIEATLADAINFRTKLLDGSNIQAAWARQNLAGLLLTYGDLAGAELLQREALQMVRHVTGPASWETAASLGMLVGVQLELKKFADAEPSARECLALREKLRPDDWRTAYARSQLGAVLLGQRKNAEAGPLLVAGAEGLLRGEAKIFPASARRFVGTALGRAAQFCETTGDRAGAAAWRAKLDAFNQADAARRAALPSPPPPTAK